VVEGERSISVPLESALRRAGSIHHGRDQGRGLSLFAQSRPELVLLDLMLPDGDGRRPRPAGPDDVGWLCCGPHGR
jgi:DNA-binding response OmpR family regulator